MKMQKNIVDACPCCKDDSTFSDVLNDICFDLYGQTLRLMWYKRFYKVISLDSKSFTVRDLKTGRIWQLSYFMLKYFVVLPFQ